MIRMTRTHRRDLIRAHPRFRGRAHDALFLLADAPDGLKLHAAFAHLYPSACVEIEPLGGSVRIPRDGEQSFHGIVNTDSTAT